MLYYKQRCKWTDKKVQAKGKIVPFQSSASWIKSDIIRNIIIFEKNKAWNFKKGEKTMKKLIKILPFFSFRTEISDLKKKNSTSSSCVLCC